MSPLLSLAFMVLSIEARPAKRFEFGCLTVDIEYRAEVLAGGPIRYGPVLSWASTTEVPQLPKRPMSAQVLVQGQALLIVHRVDESPVQIHLLRCAGSRLLIERLPYSPPYGSIVPEWADAPRQVAIDGPWDSSPELSGDYRLLLIDQEYVLNTSNWQFRRLANPDGFEPMPFHRVALSPDGRRLVRFGYLRRARLGGDRPLLAVNRIDSDDSEVVAIEGDAAHELRTRNPSHAWFDQHFSWVQTHDGERLVAATRLARP